VQVFCYLGPYYSQSAGFFSHFFCQIGIASALMANHIGLILCGLKIGPESRHSFGIHWARIWLIQMQACKERQLFVVRLSSKLLQVCLGSAGAICRWANTPFVEPSTCVLQPGIGLCTIMVLKWYLSHDGHEFKGECCTIILKYFCISNRNLSLIIENK